MERLQVCYRQQSYENSTSGIVHGGSSALFQSMAKMRVQFYERKITSAILRAQNSKFYMLGNFLETICWGIYWKLYAGNLLMETMCWEIWVDAGGLLKGIIMAQCYGITLQFQGNGANS